MNGLAYAEWVEIGYSESNGGYTTYADPSTIRNKGGLVKMWVLYDYKTIQTVFGLSYLSRRTQQQYDCGEERYRFLTDTWFSGNMTRNNEVYTNSSEQKWEPVATGCVGEAVWKVACRSRNE